MNKIETGALALFLASVALNVYFIYAPWPEISQPPLVDALPIKNKDGLTMLYPACDYFPHGLRGMPCVR